VNAIYCVTSQAIACRPPFFSPVRTSPTKVGTYQRWYYFRRYLTEVLSTNVGTRSTSPPGLARKAGISLYHAASWQYEYKRKTRACVGPACELTRAPPDRARIAPTYHRGEPEPRPLKCAYGNHTTPRPARYQRWYLTTPTNVVSFSITHCVPTLVSTQQFHTPASHTFGPLGTCRQSPEVELVHELIQLGHQHVVDAGGGGQAVVVQYLLVCRVGYRVVR
jgi:hypothetical protein